MNQITDLLERGHQVFIFSFVKRKQKSVHKAISEFKLIERTTYFDPPISTKLAKARWYLSFGFRHVRSLVREHGIDAFNPRKLGRRAYNFSLESRLLEFLKRGEFDIVHAHFGQRGKVVADLMARGRIAGPRLLTSFHGYDVNPLRIEEYKQTYKNVFLYSDAITANSPYLEGLVRQVCPKPRNLILLPESLRTDQYVRRASGGTRSDRITILFVGRLVEFKAPHLAVEIISELVNKRGLKNLELRMVGEGKLGPPVRQLIADLNLTDHVFMLGALSQERVIEEMSNADIFLLPGVHEDATGRAETQGLVVQEAQAMELPVVTSDAGGIKYGILDGVSGFVLKQRDLTGFADKLELLIKDANLRERFSRSGRSFVAANFDTRVLGDKLMGIYKMMLTNAGEK